MKNNWTMHAPILAAEDEETDALLLAMAFKKAGLPNALVIVRDGQEAVDYLAGQPPYADRSRHPLPGLLLLDLKMPRMNGFEVLEWLAARPDFKDLPVVVLSSSAYESDVAKALGMGAREYRVKPHDYKQLTGLLLEVMARWMAGGHGRALESPA
jgi:CheY-like chemotaxis protein